MSRPKPLVTADDLRFARPSDVEHRAYVRLAHALRPLRDRAIAGDARACRDYLEILERWDGGAPEEGWHLGYNC